jgi:hypothetical protein
MKLSASPQTSRKSSGPLATSRLVPFGQDGGGFTGNIIVGTDLVSLRLPAKYPGDLALRRSLLCKVPSNRTMSELGHSLHIVGHRKSLHVCNAPKADAKSEPWPLSRTATAVIALRAASGDKDRRSSRAAISSNSTLVFLPPSAAPGAFSSCLTLLSHLDCRRTLRFRAGRLFDSPGRLRIIRTDLDSAMRQMVASQFEIGIASAGRFIGTARLGDSLRGSKMSPDHLVEYWSALDGQQTVHPDDQPILPPGQFAIDLQPLPWNGPLRSARVYILLLNPRWKPTDHEWQQQPKVRKTLRFNLTGNGPYLYLDREFCGRPGNE